MSILGPLIFLLLFADDITILLTDTSLKYSITAAEIIFSLVFKWFIANRLLVNFTKTHFIVFGHSFLMPGYSLHISNQVIQ